MASPSSEALRRSDTTVRPENPTNTRLLSTTEDLVDIISQRTIQDLPTVSVDNMVLENYQIQVLDYRKDLRPEHVVKLSEFQCSALKTGRYLRKDVEGLEDQQARTLQKRRFDQDFNRAEVENLSNEKAKVLSEREDLYRKNIEHLEDFQARVLPHRTDFSSKNVEKLSNDECLRLICIEDDFKDLSPEEQFFKLKTNYQGYILHLKQYSFKNAHIPIFQEGADKKYEKLEAFVTLYPDFKDRLPEKCNDL